jgi:hypothetical protein
MQPQVLEAGRANNLGWDCHQVFPVQSEYPTEMASVDWAHGQLKSLMLNWLLVA